MNEVQRIDLNDYVQTGEGGTAQAYTHKNGRTLAKLYNPGFEAERRLTAFASAKIPYMVDMVNHGRLPDEAYDSLIEFLV